MKQFYLLLLLTLLIQGCREREYAKPGPSLIYLNFNNQIRNEGILPVEFRGEKYVSYAKGVSDTCLNLTQSAEYRKPIIVEKGEANSFSDYEGITFMQWVKTIPGDPNSYVIAGQKGAIEENRSMGWLIRKTPTGGWKWEISDGINQLDYSPTAEHQPISDGRWHQIGFSIEKNDREARFYYDGNLKAIFSLEGIGNVFPANSLYIGSDPMADDPRISSFNGMIDELGIWSRVLSDAQIAGLYRFNSGKKLKPLPSVSDSLTVMTWNIWNGGTSQGKYVGVKHIASIMRKSGADVISVQETFDSGEMLAGELDYYFYRRSRNLSILSRYPLSKSYNAFRPKHFGAIQLDMGEGRNILVAPIWLSQRPNLSAYFLKNDALADTIEVREMETRGRETNFLLSEIRPFIQKSDDTPIIIAGDFNSGSHLDWTERNKENHNGLVVNFPATRFIKNSDFIDAYRQIYPDEMETPGHTWSPLYNQGLQSRMDFIFYKGDKIKPSTAMVIDTWKYEFPSNHAAVVVSFLLNDEE
ncbi:endonuclease/exonuclease/phosphatase family protein [Marinilabilia rubra]|uniref:Exotoxin n=1 Tax=Marinilabilia rubra TaxID=2162893 RepID=A0A2U2B463_9BACT|nr:endonuclease/exonuclease/phosphatase family protein [Marinilabilia rubra]PWD97848.1 exotoxin [Marinilabilia rubra]